MGFLALRLMRPPATSPVVHTSTISELNIGAAESKRTNGLWVLVGVAVRSTVSSAASVYFPAGYFTDIEAFVRSLRISEVKYSDWEESLPSGRFHSADPTVSMIGAYNFKRQCSRSTCA